MTEKDLINFKNNKEILFSSEREYLFSSLIQAGLLVFLFFTNFMTLFVGYIGEMDIASVSLLKTDNGGLIFTGLLLLLAAYILSIFFNDKKISKIVYIANVAFITIVLIMSFFELESSTDEFFGVTTGVKAGFAIYAQVLLLAVVALLYFKKDYQQKIVNYIMNVFSENQKESNPSKFDEISKAKTLLDEGTITEEEFNKIKEDLLK